MGYGVDLLIYPEGTWNMTPNALSPDLWPGVYRIACETGAKVIPIIHYLRDNNTSKSNPIHTVVDDPIRIDDMSEQQALSYIRDIFATWYYLMIEAYSKSTRDEILGTFSFVVATAVRGTEDILRFRYHPRATAPEEAFAYMDDLIPCRENAFLLRDRSSV